MATHDHDCFPRRYARFVSQLPLMRIRSVSQGARHFLRTGFGIRAKSRGSNITFGVYGFHSTK
jgi:hypothetical protein